jgi:hypothetical protein
MANLHWLTETCASIRVSGEDLAITWQSKIGLTKRGKICRLESSLGDSYGHELQVSGLTLCEQTRTYNVLTSDLHCTTYYWYEHGGFWRANLKLLKQGLQLEYSGDHIGLGFTIGVRLFYQESILKLAESCIGIE